jgi:hypothetical protein|tara:strand:+ start:287 stop:454 length:168 start_codon:yes stop_codon:yes gene_type:complete
MKENTTLNNNTFDFETNFITCDCKKPILYPRNLGDGGYDWCKNCDRPLGAEIIST